ncbi:Lipase (class 2) [Saccharopolyspora antimicrobica]|uniref:Lipase (Class 2) n=1 Tax=Saccharopolyspora antimicrobica TaxID=455193 RepID=A0A1I5EVN6_9PSEU|nr:alpha/beta fold hydrolase [Saccharopolyspora antimicrobica]RKT83551.1 lipase (class 2) [Saccharopolyspora antimicrobica]SFO15091.1 Lipase (class 2) [Saccharopolyspora antimicrobica]
MRIRGALAGLAALLAVTAVATPATAEPANVEPAPPGVNDWSCQPSEEHPTPVVLVHGLGGSAPTNWAYLGPELVGEGYCVYALTYGRPPLVPPITGGFAPMEESAPELAAFVDDVLAATGAAKVDLVGHSEGTVMPQYYLKFLGGADKVQRYVAITPLYDGTTLQSTSELLDRLAEEIPVVGEVPDELCGSCRQLFKDSEFMTKLNADGPAVPGVEYTTIMTQYDQLVTPYTSGHLDGATNIVLQDVCPADFSEHIAVAFNPNVGRLVLNALDPANARPVRC